MFYLAFITLWLLQNKMTTITAQYEMIPQIPQYAEIIKDNLYSEDAVSPKNNMEIDQNTYNSIQESRKQELEGSDAERRFGLPSAISTEKPGPLVVNTEFEPKPYEDQYVLAEEAQRDINQGFLNPQNKPEPNEEHNKNYLHNRMGSTRLFGSVIETAQVNVDPSLMPKIYDDTDAGVIETEPITQGLISPSTIKELDWNSNIYDEVSVTTESNVQECDEQRDETSYPATETIYDSVTRAHIYVLYTVTNIVLKSNNKNENNRQTYIQTRSTNPYKLSQKTVTRSKSFVNNKPQMQQRAFSHPTATKTKEARTSTAKHRPGPFIKQTPFTNPLKFQKITGTSPESVTRTKPNIQHKKIYTYHAAVKKIETRTTVKNNPELKLNVPFTKVFNYMGNFYNVTKENDAEGLQGFQYRAFDSEQPYVTELSSPQSQKMKHVFNNKKNETFPSHNLFESYDPPTHKIDFTQKNHLIQTNNKVAFKPQITQKSKPAIIKNTIKRFFTHPTKAKGVVNKIIANANLPITSKGILRAQAIQKNKPGMQKNTTKKTSTPLVNRPSFEPKVNLVPKIIETATETFHAQADNQPVNIPENVYPDDTYPPRNEIQMQAFEKKGFDGYTSKPFFTQPSPAKTTEIPNYADFTPNTDEDKISVTETLNPTTKPSSVTTRKKATYITYFLTESNSTPSSLKYPWLLTKVFKVGTLKTLQTRSNFMYDYPERHPKQVLRVGSEITKRELRRTAKTVTQQTQIFADRIEQSLQNQEDSSFQGRAHEESEIEPFSVFLGKLVKILSSKSLKNLQNLVEPFRRYVIILLDSGKLMKLGLATGSYIAQMTSLLTAPIKDIQKQMFIIRISLENRRMMLDEGFNAMLDELDDVFDIGEEDAMQRVLRETKAFPNITESGEQLVTGFIDDVLLHPIRRVAGTAKGNVVFASIAQVASKYNVPYDPVGRRNEYRRYNKLTNSPVRIVLDEENSRVIHIENKLMKPEKPDNYSQEDIMNTHLNDKDEDSSNNDDGVEIKILINARKNKNKNKTPKIIKEKKNILVKSNIRKIKNKLGLDDEGKNKGSTRNAENIIITKTPLYKHSEIKEKREGTLIAERRSLINKNVKNKTKLKIQFDCQPLPVIVSNTNLKQTASKEMLSEMVMYCSNATNASDSS